MTASLAVTGGPMLERLSRVDYIGHLRKVGGREGAASTHGACTSDGDGSG